MTSVRRSGAVLTLVAIILVWFILCTNAVISVSELHRFTRGVESPALRSKPIEASIISKQPLNPVVLVVLGNEPLDDLTPTVDTASRVRKAVEVHRDHPGSIIVFSGGPTAGKTTEARFGALYINDST